ncbi:hypothetical protein ACQPU1_02345 [Clostridium paraputrificum]|uniref:hypothetical protein n=1 Tax=Clostridium paraputrificum TaxID=29363 RepID=UPI003D346CC8
MNKTIFTLLLTATILAPSTAIVASPATLEDNSKVSTIDNSVKIEETIKISSTWVDSTTGKTNIKVNFATEEYNSILVIYDNGKELYKSTIMKPTKELDVPVTLPSYDSHQITAYLEIASPTSTPYGKSNTITLGYFNPNTDEKIALSYVELNAIDTSFNVILPNVNQNVFVNVYDNGLLIYKTKLIRLTDKIQFTVPIEGSGRHDIKAYVGLYSFGTYGYTPYLTSNAVTIFK